MLDTRIGDKQMRALRSAGTLLKKGERDPRTSLRVHIIHRESPVLSEANCGSVEARERNGLRAAQVPPTSQFLSKLVIRSRDHPVDKVGWQCRILGQSV